MTNSKMSEPITEGRSSTPDASAPILPPPMRGGIRSRPILFAGPEGRGKRLRRASIRTAVSVLYRAFGGGWTIASSDSGIDKASIR